jgi:uncharacterized protein (TIGR02611 family)
LGFLRRLGEMRDDLILSRARPYMDDGERIVSWVRARRYGSRDDGFVFLTDKRVIVYWSRREDGHFSIPWESVVAWGLDATGAKGPVLAIESPEERAVVLLRVGTDDMASRVRGFLGEFGDLAPIPKRVLHPSGEMGDVVEWHPDVQRERRTVVSHTRRIVVTVIGVALIVFAVIIIPLPGPWSILLTIAGLALLASEYDWAQDLRDWAHDRYVETKRRLQSRKRS